MSQYYSNLKKRLEQSLTVNETEITEVEDSQLRKDIDKLRNLWKSVKEVPNYPNQCTKTKMIIE